jgi:serine/threonine protein kinase
MIRYCYNCELEVEVLEDKISNAGLCPLCKTIILRSASKLQPGTILGGFQIIEEIGRGGMGIVYKAKQLNLERLVAVKVLADDLANDEEFVANFFKEARAAASLNHPNIVQVYDAGISNEGIYYFAMELISGETVEEHLEKVVKLDPQNAIDIAIKIAKALDYAWTAKQLTHGDIKPDNIIMDKDSCAKLADLGLAKCINDDFSEGNIMATPLYAPPEIIKGEYNKIGSQSDMYSFGITLYQMIAGTAPFPNDSPDAVIQMHLNQIPSSLQNYNSRLHPELVSLVQKTLEKDPSDRPNSWKEIYKILESIENAELDNEKQDEIHKVFKVHNAHTPKTTGKSKSIKKSYFSKIKTILFILIILPLLVVSILILINPNNCIINSDSITPSTETTSNLNKSIEKKQLSSLNKFKNLKQEISSCSLKVKIKKLKKFIKEEDNPPQEAIQELNSLKISQKAISNKRKKEQFRTKMYEISNFISQLNINEFSDIKQAKKYNEKIPQLLNKLKTEDYLKSCPQWEKSLIKSRQSLKNYFTNYEGYVIKQKQAEQEQLRKSHAAAQSIDAYYKLLSNYLQNKKIKQFHSELAQWQKDAKDAPEVFLIKAKFLSSNLQELKKLYDYIFKYPKALKNKKLPSKSYPPELLNFKVNKTTKIGLIMEFDNGKVIIKKTFKFNKISTKQLSVILIERYLKKSNKQTELPIEGFNAFFFYILLQEPQILNKALTTIQFPNDTIKKMWLQIKNDFNISNKETEKIKALEKISNYMQNDNYNAATELFSKFKNRFNSDSQKNEEYSFKNRHKLELSKLESMVFSVSPAVSVKNIYNKLIKQTPSSELFTQLIILEAKYYNILTIEEKNNIHQLKSKILKQFSNTNIKNNTSPDNPFSIYLQDTKYNFKSYSQLLNNNSKYSSKKNIESIATLLTALYLGDFLTAKKLYIKTNKISAFQLYKNKATAKWAGPLLFARGVLAIQLGNTPIASQDVMNTFLKINKKPSNPELKAYNTALSMEFALISGNIDLAANIGKSYKYHGNLQTEIETKIVLLSILTLINSSEISSKRINDIYEHALRKNIKIIKEGYSDKRLIEIALNILNGQLNSRNLKELETSKCVYPDITQRLIIAAVARYYFQDKRFNQKIKTKLLQILQHNLGHNFYNSETYKNFFLLKAALSESHTQLNKYTTLTLQENSLESLKLYPCFITIKNGCNYINNIITKDKAIQNIKEYGTASALVSRDFSQFIDAASKAKLKNIVQKKLKEKMYYQGYVCVIMNSMLYYNKLGIYNQVLNNIKGASKHFSWEEKLFLKNLNSMLFNNGN